MNIPFDPELDDLPELDLEKASHAAVHYSRACQVTCQVIDATGETPFCRPSGGRRRVDL
jgi:hypothetical protein